MTERRSSRPMQGREGPAVRPYIADLLANKRVVVCCGAGGVGKTTTAAALGVGAAMLGRKTLVLTIDPARRLAEAIGSPQAARAPVPVNDTRLAEAGITGTLATWMVDPRVVFERMVRRLTADPEQAEAILQNRIYRALAQLVAGMQEYTAAEALYGFVESGEYDVVVLDTPPSRNALDFLEAPRKLSLFLDERIIGVFLPGSGGGGIFRSRARQIAHGVFSRIFGEGFFDEVQQFLAAFSGMFTSMRSHAESVRTLLKSEASSFVVVTSPEPAALAEAAHLEKTLTGEMQLPFSGFILNRSWAYTRGLASPTEIVLPKDAAPVDHSAVAKLDLLAQEELRLAERDRLLLAKLRAKTSAHAVATPQLDGDIDFAALLLIAESLVRGAGEEDALEIPSSRRS
ncbi:MAG TPA: ArsA-related P-loop ATPase [Polyangiaceae bacterium]|nr:ArsA-related P-loop ATPase [Polyangiaceae bacterium]